MFMSAMVQVFSWGERWMFYSTSRSRVEWNISSFTEWKYLFHYTNGNYSLFVLYNLYKDSYFLNKFKRKSIERRHQWSQASNSTQEYYACARVTKPHSAPAAFSLLRVSYLIFLISFILKASVWSLYWKYWTL